MTPKTAFRTLGRSNSASAAGVLKNIAGCSLNVKPEKFTKELLQPDRKDDELLNTWTVDFSAIEDWTEKSRFVWVILKEMNLMTEYKIESKKLCEFVTQIRDGYNYYNNAYHNYDHGVSGIIIFYSAPLFTVSSYAFNLLYHETVVFRTNVNSFQFLGQPCSSCCCILS